MTPVARRIAAVAIAGTLAACHSGGRDGRGSTGARAGATATAAAAAPSPRATVARYLDHMLAGRYAQAWPLLATRDRPPRAEFLAEWRATDATRVQLAQGREPTYRVLKVDAARDPATVIVRLTTILSTSRLRFQTTLEDGRWRILHSRSWIRLD